MILSSLSDAVLDLQPVYTNAAGRILSWSRLRKTADLLAYDFSTQAQAQLQSDSRGSARPYWSAL